MQKSSSLTKKLAAYSAAATIAVGAGLAHGAGQLTTVNTTLGPGESLDIDFDNNGDAEFQVVVNSSTTTNAGTTYQYFTATINSGTDGTTDQGLGFIGNGRYVSALSSGNPINDTVGFTNATLLRSYSTYSSTGLGYFTGNNTRYAGVSFNLNGVTHYGWIELQVSTDGSSVTVTRYYYDDQPMTALFAGQNPSAVTMSDVATSTASNPVGVMALLTGALAALSGMGLWVRERVFRRDGG